MWSISFLGIIAQNNKYFVDMGVRADNGDVLLWANGDLASLKDGSFVILEQDQIGDTYGWGDITGKAVGTNLSQYGGVNPSVEISGNPSFDITTSKLGSEYRLPTCKEIERLVKNSRISTFKARRNLPAIDSYGVPTWIYGQWMWQGGGNWHSIKFDGPIANIISSDKGRITTTYEGVYKYKDGILYIGNLKLSADKERNVLSADNGGFFIKVSSQSDEAENREARRRPAYCRRNYRLRPIQQVRICRRLLRTSAAEDDGKYPFREQKDQSAVGKAIFGHHTI